MTIKTRNNIILLGLTLIVILFAAFLISVFLIFQRVSIFSTSVLQDIDLTAVLISLLSELLFCLASVIIFYFSFRKTTSPEIFFFIIFLIAMAFDALKSSQALFTILNLSPYYGVLLTRTIYFGRFAGTLSILASGIFLHGAEYQRMEIYLGIVLLLSFALSAAIPIDITAVDNNLLFTVGNSRELGIISVLFLTFGVLNHVLYGIQNSNKDYGLMALGLTLVVIGREILFFKSGSIALITAFLLLIGGATLYGERTHEVRLWS
ncbi:MAG: hypothetical protein HN368_04060 [Spirochaetales bacterium]|nr:hypothetical protein [Spirochaetales bacterium]